MRIVYMGTPDFAATVLGGLCDAGHDVVGVISQPDRPKNRGMQMVMTAVKAEALQRGLPVFQPETLKDGAIKPYLDEMQPDIIVVVAYGRLLPQYVLTYPKHGCINMHASLLPKYRGAAPIQWSMINGEKETGITAMHMEAGLDTGDIILQKKTDILPSDTAESLHDRLADIAVQTAIESLAKIEKGTATRQKQDDNLASYAPLLQKDTGRIDWTASSDSIVNLVRGLSPRPGAYTFWNEARVKVLSAEKTIGNGRAGEVLDSQDRLVVATGDGAIEITMMQLPGKRAMTASACMQGNRIQKQTILGE